ncbi:diguanylate cyclase/phosphodiesterase [Litorimonas taeanensis]|uniref:Diguanylate cyclase/phosphodiesterase n=1 Tax=Litorimonas taeanensis TaxID=568099 RepID=A0A420WD53_9PROT|nr:EAL domain-containing protein [Litorimonas taeanensis]RKQ68885.1 diguanylate cyclase/phosphodiesterase [Litorimonas taeanensis]
MSDNITDMTSVLMEIPSIDVATQSSNISQAELELLKASVFRLEGQSMIWPDRLRAAALIRIAPSELPQKWQDWRNHIHEADKRQMDNALNALSWDGAKTTQHFRVQTGEDRWITLEMTVQRQSEQQGERIAIGVLRDITDERDNLERSLKLSSHDLVTGLPNKTKFMESVWGLSAIAQRLNAEGRLFRIHVENLDDIHQIYGYETGERLLSAFADRLRQIIHAPDCAGKDSDGDFFIGVMGLRGPDSNPEILARRLKLALSERPFQTPQGAIKLDLAIAHTIFPQRGRDVETLMAQTARALGAEPNAQITAYNPMMGLPSSRPVIEFKKEDIFAALNENRVSLAYQPIIHAKSGALCHYECLLRLREKTGEFVSAGRMIMKAEQLGLVHILDRRALEIAAAKLQSDSELRLALNVSAETVKDTAVAANYIKALKVLGPLTRRIVIELTETAALNDPSLAAKFSSEARALGCEFAIDDFGSGHTSFRNLMAIEAETIKIDGSQINGISTKPQMQTFVRMMVDLAQTFSVKTVAEMVEDPADAALLRRLGVDYFQGYLFGMPLSEPSYVTPK